MFARNTNINVEAAETAALQCNTITDTSPLMLAGSLLVLRQCFLSETNKNFKVKLILERIPSLLKDQQDPKDHEVLRLKCWSVMPMQHLHEINVVSGKGYYTFRVNTRD